MLAKALRVELGAVGTFAKTYGFSTFKFVPNSAKLANLGKLRNPLLQPHISG
jgi:hypothetical protein